MAEVLPFECEHEAQCHESGWEFSKDCPERCTLRKEKRVKELERVVKVMFRFTQGLNAVALKTVSNAKLRTDGNACISDLAERLKTMGVRVDEW